MGVTFMKVICSTRISRDPYDGTMSNPTFDLVQWPYPELVKQLQQNILNLLETVQARNGISLERLEGVTIVPNLIEALRTFDAGYPSDHAAAMRDAVMGRMITALRDGRVQGHVFLRSTWHFKSPWKAHQPAGLANTCLCMNAPMSRISRCGRRRFRAARS